MQRGPRHILLNEKKGSWDLNPTVGLEPMPKTNTRGVSEQTLVQSVHFWSPAADRSRRRRRLGRFRGQSVGLGVKAQALELRA